MPRYLRLIPSLIFVLICAYVVWVWVRWFKSGKTVTPKWRARIAVIGFCSATFSMILTVFLFFHASFTGGYPFYHPVELFCIRFGTLSALIGLVAVAVGKGQLRIHVALISALNLFLWFMDAVAQ